MYKIAMPRYMKLFQEGRLSLEALTNLSKKLKLKPRLINDIGVVGGEGMTQLVTHPEVGLAAKKTYNTLSPLFSPELIKNKIRIQKKISPKYIAKYLEHDPNSTAIYSEYMGNQMLKLDRQGAQAQHDEAMRLLKAIKRRHPTVRIGDVHRGNVVGGKVVDFLPEGYNALKSTNAGEHQRRYWKLMRKDLKDRLLLRKPLFKNIHPIKSHKRMVRGINSKLIKGSQVPKNDILRNAHDYVKNNPMWE